MVSAFQESEFARWRELFGEYNRFYGVELDGSIYAATWRRVVDPDGALHALTVRDGSGRPVGLAHYLFHGSSWSTNDVCYLEDLFVEPAARGQRYGAALIAGVADVARAHGCTRLYWLTKESNATARRLYDRVATNSGFIRYDVALGGSD